MNKKPFFSVVIPTRNRAKLLPLAVRSVLNQTFDNFEVIISDNFSSDATSHISHSFGDKRVKYFRSSESLSIGDSWDFALSHAQGEYIAFLSDDDAYTKIFLETIFNVLDNEKTDIVTCKLIPYYAIDAYAFGKKIQKHSLLIPSFDGKVHVLDKKQSINLIFSMFRLTNCIYDNSINIPQLVNSVYHHSVLQKAKKRVKKIFPIVGSDIYSSALFLNIIESYSYINKPLYLHAQWEGSETAGNQSIFEKHPEERNLNYVPLKKFLSPYNYGANAILRAKADWGEDYYDISLDYTSYFTGLFYELKYLQAKKIDVTVEIEEFYLVLGKQDIKLQQEILSAISNYSLTKTRLKLAFKQSRLGKAALRFKNRNFKVIGGFGDIAECAELIDERFLNDYIS